MRSPRRLLTALVLLEAICWDAIHVATCIETAACLLVAGSTVVTTLLSLGGGTVRQTPHQCRNSPFLTAIAQFWTLNDQKGLPVAQTLTGRLPGLRVRIWTVWTCLCSAPRRESGPTACGGRAHMSIG